MASFQYKMNNAGIREISMSKQMQEVLGAEAQKIADKACADAYSHSDWLYKKAYETEPYVSGKKVLSNTAIGYVTTKSSVGALNENKYKSLSNTNH